MRSELFSLKQVYIGKHLVKNLDIILFFNFFWEKYLPMLLNMEKSRFVAHLQEC